MANYHTPLTEQYVLACLLDNKKLIRELKDNHFLNNESKIIYNSLKKLNKESIAITTGNILLECSKHSDIISAELLEAIPKIDYDLDSFDHYVETLKKNYTKFQLKHDTIEKLLLEVDNKENFDYNKVEELFREGREHLRELNGNDKAKIVHPSEGLDQVYENLKVNNSSSKNSIGNNDLDKELGPPLPGELTWIFGRTSQGKSAYKNFLINGQINRRIPFLSIDLEMSLDSSLLRLACMRYGLPMSFWYEDDENGGASLEDKKYYIDKMKKELEDYPLARFLDAPNLSLDELEEKIIEYKEIVKPYINNPNTVINIWIDLLSMITDYKEGSGNSAFTIEKANDRLSSIAKKHAVHITGIIQANRDTEGKGDKKVKKLEDVKEFRPTLKNLKNSGSYEERARRIIGIFRPLFYVRSFLPEQESLLDDIMQVQVLKCSNGRVGKIFKWLTDLSRFKFYKYEPLDDEDDPNEI